MRLLPGISSTNNPSNPTLDNSDVTGPFDHMSSLVDIAPVADVHLAELGDHVEQSRVLENIITSPLHDPANADPFTEKAVHKLRLSRLQRQYEEEDPAVIDVLSNRHKISIDKKYKLEFGTGEILMDTSQSMIDYQLVVANAIGIDILLPNVENDHRFNFEMNLKCPQKQFKGKYGMVGFDTKGCMLFIGRANNEEVYLAMAPNEFLLGHYEVTPAGHSSGSSTMSRRHYRQMVMMFSHFLSMISHLAYNEVGDGYGQDLEANRAAWSLVTNIMYVQVLIIHSFLLPSHFFMGDQSIDFDNLNG